MLKNISKDCPNLTTLTLRLDYRPKTRLKYCDRDSFTKEGFDPDDKPEVDQSRADHQPSDSILPNLKTFTIKVMKRQDLAIQWFLTDILAWPQFSNGKWAVIRDGSIKLERHQTERFLQYLRFSNRKFPDTEVVAKRQSEPFENSDFVRQNVFHNLDNEDNHSDSDSEESESDHDSDEDEGKDFEWIPAPYLPEEVKNSDVVPSKKVKL